MMQINHLNLSFNPSSLMLYLSKNQVWFITIHYMCYENPRVHIRGMHQDLVILRQQNQSNMMILGTITFSEIS